MFFKVLNNDGSCVNGGVGTWHLPTKNDDGTWTPGEWMPAVEGDLEPCENGYHLCREQDLLQWLGPAIFAAEYRKTRRRVGALRRLLLAERYMIEAEDKIVVREARLLRRFENWNERTARLFACDCAERAVHLCGDDPRPRRAIDVARRYANGEATDEELDAARDAAWNAAWDAAWNAAWDAAWNAARAARDAAGDAAWDAAWDAARAARDAAGDAEQKWQVSRLMEYLNGA